MIPTRLTWILYLSVSIVASTSYADPRPRAEFIPLGDLPGGFFESHAYAVSADGSTIVGTGTSDFTEHVYYYEPFRWTRSTGIVTLGELPDDLWSSDAFGVSADGSVVVGYAHTSDAIHAFRWTENTGMEWLGFLPGGQSVSQAHDVSGDGSVVVGMSESANGLEAFRWTEETGVTSLGWMPDTQFFTSIANAVSADGSTIVGERTIRGRREAFRWTENDGMVALDDLLGSPLPGGSAATDVSADGTIIVGWGTNLGGAFRWTERDGAELLYVGFAWAVSGDGATIVGSESGVAVRWTETKGVESILELFAAAGNDMTGWHLEGAYAVSHNGAIIAGMGTNPDGDFEAWAADFTGSLIPEPPTVWMVFITAIALLVVRKY